MLTLVSAPATALWSTADAKAHPRVRMDDSDDDAAIVSLVSAATAYFDGPDGILGRTLINQTWRETIGAFPSGDLRLSLPNVQSVSSVKYFDKDDVEQTVSASVYRLISGRNGAYLELTQGASWPVSYSRSGAVKVEFVAGYGASDTDVPQPIREAALIVLGMLYDSQDMGDGGYESMPFTVRHLVANYRVPGGFI